jgi:hypothetical protein
VVVVKWVVTWPLAFEWERVVEVTRPLAFEWEKVVMVSRW